jgi:hypothetical protein
MSYRAGLTAGNGRRSGYEVGKVIRVLRISGPDASQHETGADWSRSLDSGQIQRLARVVGDLKGHDNAGLINRHPLDLQVQARPDEWHLRIDADSV